MTWETSERKHATHVWREKHLTVLSLGCTCFSASFSWRPLESCGATCAMWIHVAQREILSSRVCFLVFLFSFLTLLALMWRYVKICCKVVKIKWRRLEVRFKRPFPSTRPRQCSENHAWKQNIKATNYNKETIVIENAISLSVPFAPVIWAADAKSARFSNVATKNPPVSIKCLPHALDCQVKEGDWNLDQGCLGWEKNTVFHSVFSSANWIPENQKAKLVQISKRVSKGKPAGECGSIRRQFLRTASS